MYTQPSRFILISAFYFVSWFILIVLFLLTGPAQIGGGAMTLFALVRILSSLQFPY